MDKTHRHHNADSGAASGRTPTGSRSRRGAQSHPMVASLACGLRATYAAQTEDTVTEHFASLIARLDRGASHTG